MGLLYQLSGYFPTTQTEFLLGINAQKPVILSFQQRCSGNAMCPDTWHELTVSQQPLLYTYKQVYHDELHPHTRYLEIGIPQENRYPSTMCRDAERIIASLSKLGIAPLIRQGSSGPRSFDQIVDDMNRDQA